jgi:hypothetical protein
VARRMEATAAGIEDLAAGGSLAHEHLVREGVPTLVHEDKAWVGRNAGRLDAAPSRARRAADSHGLAGIMAAQSGRSAAW